MYIFSYLTYRMYVTRTDVVSSTHHIRHHFHSFSPQGKGKGKIDDVAADAIEEAAEDDENETMLVRAEIEGDMSVPCSGKGCPKSDDETTDDIEARTDAGEPTEEEIVSIRSCKGRKCKEQNTTSIEEEIEGEKPCKGKKCDKVEETADDIEVRADADETTEDKIESVRSCKGKKCEEDAQEIANLAEAGVAEAAAMATEDPSKVSKVSKMSSDETEVSTIVCGSHHLLLFFNKRFPSSLFAYFLLTQQKSLPIVPRLFLNNRMLPKLLLPMLVISPRLLLLVRARRARSTRRL